MQSRGHPRLWFGVRWDLGPCDPFFGVALAVSGSPLPASESTWSLSLLGSTCLSEGLGFFKAPSAFSVELPSSAWSLRTAPMRRRLSASRAPVPSSRASSFAAQVSSREGLWTPMLLETGRGATNLGAEGPLSDLFFDVVMCENVRGPGVGPSNVALMRCTMRRQCGRCSEVRVDAATVIIVRSVQSPASLHFRAVRKRDFGHAESSFPWLRTCFSLPI